MSAAIDAPTTARAVSWFETYAGLIVKVTGWIVALMILSFRVGGHLNTIERNLEVMNSNLAALTEVAEAASQAAANNRRDIDVMKERQTAILATLARLDPTVRDLELLVAELRALVPKVKDP